MTSLDAGVFFGDGRVLILPLLMSSHASGHHHPTALGKTKARHQSSQAILPVQK
jgi:hypothetical protein